MDFNQRRHIVCAINVALNEAIERAAATTAGCRVPIWAPAWSGTNVCEKFNTIGGDADHAARTREIFARGHYFEAARSPAACRRRIQVRSAQALEFTAVNGLLRGHADGIIIAGPELPGCI